ncbi:MAG: VWA domain-containing protein [Tissierellia bacterium]|nr:VWA domain-containing protein [Tissierellia bacterium]
MLKQIIIISDGQSNTGPNPVNMAALAFDNSIIVNTIGIIDNEENSLPIFELESIAENGGGICELSNINNLSEALSRLTVKSVYNTVEEMVSQELKEILDLNIEEIEPRERHKFIKLIDKIGSEIDLRCLILLDISGSMTNKIDMARKSIFELLLFLEERIGKNHIGVIAFPYKNTNCKLLCDFTQDIDILKQKIKILETGGTTPTGYAIEEAIKIFTEEQEYPIYDNII